MIKGIENKKGQEFALGWVIGIAIILIVLVVIIVFWRVAYNAIAGLPG